MIRRLTRIAAAALAVVLLAAGVGVLVVRGSWFREKVRVWLVDTVETATGGRVEIGSLQFDWAQLRAEVRSFTLHGAEPAGKPPLFHAASAAVGLKIVSLWRRDVDIRYLEVQAPEVYLIVAPDGRTNLPQPRVASTGNTMEQVFKLAIGRFAVERGTFEIESRGKTPFDARGQNLAAALEYDPAGPRYRGRLSVQPLELAWPKLAPTPFAVTAQVSFERNRVAIESAELASGDSKVVFSGGIENLASPHGTFRYDARVVITDLARVLGVQLLDRGTVETTGEAVWRGGSDFQATGTMHSSGLEFHDAYVRLAGFQADGALTISPAGIEVRAMRLSGAARLRGSTLPVSGLISTASLRGQEVRAHGIDLALLDGAFRGDFAIQQFDHYIVTGEISGIAARRVVALYSPERLPWDGLGSGGVRLEGSLQNRNQFHATVTLTVTAAPGGPPINGQINAAYDVRTDTLDLGRSTLSLPNSKAEASGVLGRELRVHFETRDLHDLLPVLGEDAAALPLRFEGGSAIFDGTVTGHLDDPQVTGHMALAKFSYQAKSFDALEAEVTASPANIRLANASLDRGGWRAQFQIAVALDHWKPGDASNIFGDGSLRGAPLADLASLAAIHDLPATGAVDGSARISGTVANPLVNANVHVTRGRCYDEPFDSFSAGVTYTNGKLEVAAGELSAGAKQVRVNGTYTHPPDRFDTGRLTFDISTNAMPLGEIATLARQRPGLAGTAQMTAHGTVDLVAAPSGQLPVRIADLQADIAARGLRLAGQTFGDLNLTASSQGPVLRAHLDSNFANSTVRGDGEWRLEGDYPGGGSLNFTRLDFAQLRAWLAGTAAPAASNFTGFAAGSLRVDGPALEPRALKAELSIQELEVAPSPQSGLGSAGPTLRNSGPILAAISNSTVTVTSARLRGRNTDLTITGKIALAGSSPLDLRVAGRIDLAAVHDWNSDVTANGTVTADATVRGAFDAPQILGRVEFQQAGFTVADAPNGISNANGVILFNGNRASIQRFTGETGGGQIELSGFAAYGGGPALFRLHANLKNVRVRYPEGVSTQANATLNLTGTSERSMLSGTVTILHNGFNPQSDFSSLIAQSAEPVRTPSAGTGFLGGMNFDVQINTAPDILVESSLTEDVQLEANLHLRGSPANPALLGRINITQGQVVFFGTRYNIGQGSISFFNPLTVEPVLNIDLDTKAQGIEVTLTVSGPLNKLNLTPRSDPPLQFSEIVALLATGRTPTGSSTMLAGDQTGVAPSWQQMGASALLGQAIASPVTGRLQRFFGVSRLRIDPTLPGLEYNPQARLTLEQQVSQNITFTYITDVTSANPLVVSVEWAFSKKWSVVTQRDENGEVGMNIFFKKRF